ncbi:phytoene synthase [Roseibium hamelinense]|uniref:Phytoene synthase n=1 Tax=Roseibium hamelinense TaxID=150831 RepID=A0A562SXI9_9HYPH|nr:phytoene/squalene synthase family protein [Roseibium hamelinense]TWI85971.1 phytoene synthase [Roseibium hamelinense]
MLAKTPKPFALPPELQRTCDLAINDGSKSFMTASLLLPPDTRCAARALYAFCRNADDLIDDAFDPQESLELLRNRLSVIYSTQKPVEACDQAFAILVKHFDIPRHLPDALIEGFAWDAAGKRYETLEDLKGYAARVASTVGVMMTLVMGQRDAATLARAADLGLAMQLTNIARDVGEDALNARVYLPLKWLSGDEHDLPLYLERGGETENIRRATQRLLTEADILYKRALTGIAELPFGCRIAITSAGLIYRAIGDEVARNRFDSITRRAHTSTTKKLFLVGLACLKTSLTRRCDTAPPDPATRFLTEPCIKSMPQRVHGLDAKAARMLELIALSEMRRRENHERSGLNA